MRFGRKRVEKLKIVSHAYSERIRFRKKSVIIPSALTETSQIIRERDARNDYEVELLRRNFIRPVGIRLQYSVTADSKSISRLRYEQTQTAVFDT